jgi:AsmA protein
MKKIYALAALTVIAVVLALGAGVIFSTGWAVQALQERAAKTLGRNLTVRGGASLDIAADLALRFNTVDLANSEGLDGAFITAEAIRVPMTLSDLLQHRLGQNFTLVAPQIGLEINEKGDAAWAFTGPGEQTAAPARFTITGGTLRYYDHRNDQHFELRDAELAADITAEGAVTLNGSAVLAGRAVTLDAYVKSLPRVALDGAPVELSLQSPLLQASYSGRLSTASTLSLAGTASFAGPSLRDAMQWAGIILPGSTGFGAFSLSGQVDGSGRDISLHDAKLSLDALTAEGRVGLVISGERPQILADLGVDRLDIGSYLPPLASSAPGWSEQPLNYADLRNLDARLALNTNGLTYGALSAGKSTAQLSLTAGRLDGVITSEDTMGGTARLDVQADGTGTAPLLSLHVEGQKLDGLQLTSALAGAGFLAGPLSLSLNVSGYGPSTAAIVSTLKGTAKVSADAASLAGIDLKAIAAAVTQRIVEGWQRLPEATTTLNALSAEFEIADGIATAKAISLQSPEVSLKGSGSIDLLRQAIDLAVVPSLGAAAFAVPVIVKGPWASPRIYPDVPDILLKPEEGFARLKAMGLPQSTAN